MLSYFQHQANRLWFFIFRRRISALRHPYKLWKDPLRRPALPVEILSIIVEIAVEKDNATGAALCRTCRSFKEMVVKHLYRAVYITSDRCAKRFLQKLELDWSDSKYAPILSKELGIFPVLEIRHLYLDCQIPLVDAAQCGGCTPCWTYLVFRRLRNLRGVWITSRAAQGRNLFVAPVISSFTHLGIIAPRNRFLPPSLNLTHLYIKDDTCPGVSYTRYFVTQHYLFMKALTHLIVATRLPKKIEASFQIIHTEVLESLPPTVTHCVFWLSRGESTAITSSPTTATFNDPLTLEYLRGRMNERIMIATTEPWPELPSDEEWTKFVPFWDPSVVDGLSGEFMDDGSMWNEIDRLFAARRLVLRFHHEISKLGTSYLT